MFILLNIWMVGKNSMKHHYLRRDFYGHLNMEDINDADYTQPKIVYKDFETKHLGECHDFCVQMIHYC